MRHGAEPTRPGGEAPRPGAEPARPGAATMRPGVTRDLLDLLPPTLDAIAEGAWLAIAYLVLQVLGAHGPILLGPIQFAALAGLGIAISRGALPWSGRGPLAAATVIAALGGWLVAPQARDAVLLGHPDQALAFHAGGFLAGIAVLRGAAHGEAADDDLELSRLLAWGLPGLAVPWLLAQAVGPGGRAAFLEPAFVATLTFVVATLLAIALARLDALGSRSGVDWRNNPAWLLVLLLVVAATIVVGLPLAAALGIPLDAALRGAIGPLWFLVMAAIAVVAIPFGLIATALVYVVRALLGPARPLPPVATSTVHGFNPESATGLPSPVFAVIAIAIVVAVLVVLAWQLLPAIGARRATTVGEERGIVLPGTPFRPSLSLPRFRSRPAAPPPPHDAVTAYVAAIGDLGAVPSLARATDETPASHTRRLRTSGRGMTALDLLAADYALVRYAGRPISRAEDRRGLERWRRIRAQARAVAAAGDAGGNDAPSAGTSERPPRTADTTGDASPGPDRGEPVTGAPADDAVPDE